MVDNPLKIMSVETGTKKPLFSSKPVSKRQEIQAKMERLWLLDPEQFNPLRDVVERKRVSETMKAIKNHEPLLEGKLVADIGCGSGVISRLVRDCGAAVHAVDVAGNALQKLKEYDTSHIYPMQDCLSQTKLEDRIYDLVLCLEVIGYLEPKEYRLVFSELSRLLKSKGIVACSTSIDLDSDDALERFAALAETEFEIEAWVLNYHRLWIKLMRVLDIPAFYVKSGRDKGSLKFKNKLSSAWFYMNTCFILRPFWIMVSFMTTRWAKSLRQSVWLMNVLEKTTQFLWGESGVSHALFIGSLRPMNFPLPKNEIPKEMPLKRVVWE